MSNAFLLKKKSSNYVEGVFSVRAVRDKSFLLQVLLLIYMTNEKHLLCVMILYLRDGQEKSLFTTEHLKLTLFLLVN